MSNILHEIEKTGFYWYTPNKWNNKTDEEIGNLLEKGKIVSIKFLNIKFMNEDFCFTLPNNPYNVRLRDDGESLTSNIRFGY
jgi:hypothetical protein